MWNELAVAVVLQWYKQHYESLGFKDSMGSAATAADFAWKIYNGKSQFSMITKR